MQKSKVLYYKYDDKSNSKPVRVYLENDFEQAESDLGLMKEHASDCKEWFLEEVEVCKSSDKLKFQE